MFKQTALTSADSYKLGHADQYPPGTTKVYSNFTPRSMHHFNVIDEFKDGRVVWFGLQLFLTEMKEIWQTTFFDLPEDQVIEEFAAFVGPFCGDKGFNVSRLRELHKLGYLPLKIKALPEGVRVPVNVPVLTITNTLDAFFWLTNFMETWMSCELWKSMTSATTSDVYKKILNKYVEMTGSSPEFAAWQLHDFSVRGMSGIIDAGKSGAGHLLSSLGTDNLPAVKAINDVYAGKETFVGGSVPATEHSVMCAGGKESEVETFRRLIQTYPSGVLSIVSDTWDFWNVITNTARELKDEILNRQPDSLGLAKVVFRPDSGDPVRIIVGWEYTEVESLDDSDLYGLLTDVVKCDGKYYKVESYDTGWTTKFELVEMQEAEVKGAVECLWDIFNGTTNDKGFRTLNQRVGLIYGDSITPQRCDAILSGLMKKGFAADNIVFGIGSFTFQYQTRDSLGLAMKATYVIVQGIGTPIFKDPKTDNGTKKSAKGLLKVILEDGNYKLLNDVTVEEEDQGELKVVFNDGEIISNEKIAEIRQRLANFK